MTFLQIINLIKETALAQPNVNTFVRNFLDLNREDTVYSAVVLQDRDGLRDRISEQDWNTYTFHLGYVDRLTFDESNRDDIFSTGINIINNIVASIRDTWFPDVEVNIIDRFQTFDQRFTASCAGVYVVLAIQVPISDCVDGEQTDMYDKYEATFVENGHYHFVPSGRPIDEIDITIDCPEPKEEEYLQETIYTNGRYNFSPTEGRVFSEADITVDCPEPKEEVHLIESITENGEVHFTPESGKVYDWAEIEVDVHPTERFEGVVSNNGLIQNFDEWAGVELYIEVHPSTSLSETYTSNGSYNVSGEFNGGVVTVAVPSDKKPEQVGSFEVTEWGSAETFYPDPGYVFSEVEITNNTRVKSYTSTVASNGRLRWSASEGEALVNSIDINIDVSGGGQKPEESLIQAITVNGSYHYDPTPGSVFSGADITVDVHPSNTLSRTYTTNGTKTITGEFNGGTVNINVHPSASLSETYTTNGTYNISGEYNGGTVTVAVSGGPKPEESLIQTISGNGSYHYDPTPGSVFSGADITVAVQTTTTVTMTQAQYDALSVKDPNTIYLING